MNRLIPLTEPPSPGDIVFHENHGLVKCKVTDQYAGRHREIYPELVLLEVVEDFGDGQFKPGHQSIRDWSELLMEGETPSDERAELVGYLEQLDEEIAVERDYQILQDLRRNHDAAYERLRDLEEADAAAEVK